MTIRDDKIVFHSNEDGRAENRQDLNEKKKINYLNTNLRMQKIDFEGLAFLACQVDKIESKVSNLSIFKIILNTINR